MLTMGVNKGLRRLLMMGFRIALTALIAAVAVVNTVLRILPDAGLKDSIFKPARVVVNESRTLVDVGVL